MTNNFELSILIPARQERWLAHTIADVLARSEANTEVIAVLDGAWAEPAIPHDERVTVIYNPVSVGQRAATNQAARVSTAKYVMKLDAHCAMGQGFDRILLEDMQPAVTMVPVMRNLHIFDWVCTAGHRVYQGPSGPCRHKEKGSDEICGLSTTIDVVWYPKPSPQARSYCFDSEPHFKYFGEFTKRPEGQGPLSETMSLQGSCFLMTREKYLELDVCDETIGSWGNQGIEVACKTWLSGGRVMCNHRTWYAHLFRTQGGDFNFPYPQSQRKVDEAKAKVRDLFFNDRWPKQVRPLVWLLDHFWPVPGWTDAQREALRRSGAGLPSRGLIYYTDSQLDPAIAEPVRARLAKISRDKGLPIVSASLQRLEFGVKNIHFPSLRRGHLTMFKQILSALENSRAEVVFFTEHDVLYHESHFDFVPPRADTYYYNTNVWQVRSEDGHAVYWLCRKLSQMCCYRELAIVHFKRKIALVEANGGKYDTRLGFEPGTRSVAQGGVDDSPHGDWRSEVPNIDIRHPGTLSKSKWSKDDFRNPANYIDWQEADTVPGWGQTGGQFAEFLAER